MISTARLQAAGHALALRAAHLQIESVNGKGNGPRSFLTTAAVLETCVLELDRQENVLTAIERHVKHLLDCCEVWADTGVPRNVAITRECHGILAALRPEGPP